MTCATGKKLYYFKEALDCIDPLDKKQCHGAVLVTGNKIISRGKNKSYNRILKNNVCSIHAEIDCLNNVIGKYRRIKSRVLFNKWYYQRCKKRRYLYNSSII